MHRTVQKYEQVLQVLSKDGASKIKPNVYHGQTVDPIHYLKAIMLVATFPSSGSHLCWQIYP